MAALPAPPPLAPLPRSKGLLLAWERSGKGEEVWAGCSGLEAGAEEVVSTPLLWADVAGAGEVPLG